MTYPDREVAAVAWAADAELRALHGDPVPSLPGDAGDADAHGVTLAGIRAILGGATPEQMHEAWVRAREAQGWKRGPHLDSRVKTHPALVPYAELPEAQRVRGAVFAAVVLAMSGQHVPPTARESQRMSAATPGQAARILPAYDAVGELELSEAVYQALGAASVCWEPMDCTGVFESSRAAQIGAELIGIAGQYADDLAAQEPHAAAGAQPRPGRVTVDARDIAIALNGYAGFTGDPVSFASELHERLRRTVFADAAREPQPAPELAAERDGLRKALRAISLGIAEPSPQSVARDALNGRYFDPDTDAGVWSMSDPAEQVRLARQDAGQLRGQLSPEAQAEQEGTARAGTDARVAAARKVIGNFLAHYEDSDILMFKVGIDLANSVRKVLGDDDAARGD